MLHIDQIKELEAKVEKAIQIIQSLKDENDLLKLEMSDKQKRVEELENMILVFKTDQAKIEEGIVSALNHLSEFENSVYQAAGTPAAGASDSSASNEQSGSCECGENHCDTQGTCSNSDNHPEQSENHQAENV
ncbi:MAG: cell division protein ZapB [Treponema sp.]